MWEVFKRVLDLRVGSSTVLVLIGGVGVGLVLNSANNVYARTGGFVCLGLFAFLALYLLIYNQVRELFEGVIVKEREGHKELIKNYKDLSREQIKTAILREQSTRDGMTKSSTDDRSATFAKYKDVSQGTSGSGPNDRL